ncbi:MAG TPA: GNAT family N-acetyltransferase [Miltoncostaeaceae bacterium]|nr:GNAT family N-acetyltransferase [Miltoncostaeaceae bacterium]
MTHADVRVLEGLAARAWPALLAEPLDGWTLRFSVGAGRRANSVLPLDAGEVLGLGERIGAGERFYAARGVPARFQVSPAATPPGLEKALRRRGYRIDAPTDVLVADLDQLAREASPRAAAVAIRSAPDRAWLEAWERGGPSAEAMLRLVPHPSAFASLAGGDGAEAIGRGAVEGSWLGVFDMATRPGARRRGAATAVLAALARWGREAGARRAYLQVETANEGARAFYARLGFARHHGYRFLVRLPA